MRRRVVQPTGEEGQAASEVLAEGSGQRVAIAGGQRQAALGHGHGGVIVRSIEGDPELQTQQLYQWKRTTILC